MKKEIEVKVKTNNHQEILSKLESLGCTFTTPVTQDDAIYVNFDGDFTAFMPGTNFLRIRASGGKYLFTLKQPQKNELDCIEKETEISDPEAMEGALELMGYHLAVRVKKTRTKTKYQDMEICLDSVEGLGDFVEVEKITEGDGEEVQKELCDFLTSIGVDISERVMQGYDTLIYKQANSSH